ncbi:PoNe immunity protein domain-containing protein [Chryseobacterium sp. c4a]|uniref:PoNe immunity protein domain-containing protein n=1 Tax=Chryseobacterium sp. c4a TaxID=1573582 RepID=UPI001356BDD1|nr:PoNe immunity protein domain-containing protein [Chryseobacterium sp. c4a]
MIVRTFLKDLAYFEYYIQLNNDDIEYYLNELRAGRVAEERISAVNRQIFTTTLHTVIAKYSAGYTVQDIIPDFLKAIDRLPEGWKSWKEQIRFDDYILMLWMLSLGILLAIDDSDFSRIVSVLKANGHQDYLYDIIIAFQAGQQPLSDSLLVFPNVFVFLKELYETKDTAKLKKYLDDHWYKKMKESYWYESDKSKQSSFFGYWSFESAVFMKIVNLDDQFLKDQRYYPNDLIH